jgi:hypothetical protein
MGRTSLVVVYSRHLGMLRHQSLGAGTPWAKVGTACAYHSWFVFVAELNCLPGKLGVNLVRVIPVEGMLIPS